MRDYSIVSPKFWIGETGKSLRGNPAAQVLALYLMTCPHANMIGVFHCPMVYMMHETGLDAEGASEALASLIEARFCTYEESSETIFVHRMAAFQIAERLKPDDKRVKGVEREWLNIDSNEIRIKFHAIYSIAFNLPELEEKQGPIEAPSKPLPSQEQDQEQEQDQAPSGKFVLPDWIPKPTWAAYCKVRSGKKAKNEPHALGLIVGDLEKFRAMGHDPVQVLNNSIKSGWAGVFEPKEKPPKALNGASGDWTGDAL